MVLFRETASKPAKFYWSIVCFGELVGLAFTTDWVENNRLRADCQESGVSGLTRRANERTNERITSGESLMIMEIVIIYPKATTFHHRCRSFSRVLSTHFNSSLTILQCPLPDCRHTMHYNPINSSVASRK